MSNTARVPYAKNVPGEFYVEDGCCLSCGVPEGIAPEIFGSDDRQCYIKKQPHSEIELDAVVESMMSAEVDCIRFRGRDEAFLKRLGENGLVGQADHIPKTRFEIANRNHITFDVARDLELTPLRLSTNFKNHLLRTKSKYTTYEFRQTGHNLWRTRAWMEYSWFQSNFNRIEFARAKVLGNQFLIRTPAGHFGVTRDVMNWLGREPGYSNVNWFTKREWDAGNVQGARQPW